MVVKILLDTTTLIALSGLEDENLKDQIRKLDIELWVTHIQVDEKYHKEVIFDRKIEKALGTLKKWINVRIKPTEIAICDVSRIGYSKLSDDEIDELYDELKNEITECEKAKGRAKKPLNIPRDAITAISSISCDFFITCDECLSKSWNSIIRKHRVTKPFPSTKYVEPNPIKVAKLIIDSVHELETSTSK
jgi:predicted DNA-binding ArsR family transcriptional regulator